MWRELVFPSYRDPQFVRVFLTSIVVLALSTVFRYLTKLPILGASEPVGQLDKKAEWIAEKRAAHFDCLRRGLDLCILGLVTFFVVCRLALEKSSSPVASQLATLEPILVFILIILLGLTTLFMALFRSPIDTFWRGVLIPGLTGWLSLWVSVAVFNYLRSKGF